MRDCAGRVSASGKDDPSVNYVLHDRCGLLIDHPHVCILQVGDQVVYSKYAGTELELGGEEHVLLKEEDVVGIKNGASYKDLKPLGDRVLIKVGKAEEATSGGVLLTDSAREKPLTGEVIAVGPGKKGEENTSTISPGTTVMYQKYAGTEFKDQDGSEYIVVQGSDVMATLM
mmetsp:Transcript_7957/g.49127  ORF Transcript_7957/g.49127 Transcript_7957/m.49127 type:complete len:172 (+) Transcript_7957:526-1041(+)